MGVMRVVKPETPKFPHLHRMIACEERLEEAINFLASSMAARPRRGKKPVVLHSLRVGIALMTAGYNTNVVIAGLLHDIVEKTGISPGQIARKFGGDVALMVAANTNNPRIHDPLDRYEDSVERCAATGDGALLVRAADLIDNCDRLTTTQASRARLEKIAEKLRLLVKVGREHIADEPIYDELVRRHRRIARKVAPVAVIKLAKKHLATGKAARVASGHRRHR
jgi:(p)ppGpp synthase/HD superfamily hydrolase